MKSYIVCYRTGGSMNGQWRKCLPVQTLHEAQGLKENVTRMGYPAVIVEKLTAQAA
jgi:hypothetical protein